MSDPKAKRFQIQSSPAQISYLIQPYSASRPEAYEFSLLLIARESLYDHKTTLYSPILHYHEAAERHGLPHEFSFWLAHNLNMIDASSEVRIVCATGLMNSVGSTFEIEYARRKGIPARYYAPDSARHVSPVGEGFNRLCLFDCFQKTHSYTKLLKELETEIRGKRAGANSSELA